MKTKMVLAAGWFILGEKLTVFRSHLHLSGSPAYLTITGEESGAYALFDCENWETLTNEDQLNLLTKNLVHSYLSLPYKERNNEKP